MRILARALAVVALLCTGTLAPPTAPAPLPGADPEISDRVYEQIAAREYQASENGQGLQAPNRAQNLRTWFEPTGIRVHDRTAARTPELMQLTLSGLGRGETVETVKPGAAPVTNGNRVEIHRPGLVEWYVNSPKGLEQGFTLAARPQGEGSLVVEIAVAGAKPSLAGDAIVFETGTKRKLRYAELFAIDADGDALAAHFEVASAERLRIVVDDAGASYPVVIDPLLTETADTQLESNQTDSQLGTSVAGAGDVNGDGFDDVIVGAYGYDAGQTGEGAAFVFHGSASGIAHADPASAATQLESNQASSFGPGEVLGSSEFGSSVAGAGDVNGDGYADVIVGAPGYNADQIDEGAAFVFYGSPTGIAHGNPATAAARLESNQGGGFPTLPPVFGDSVAAAGDVNGDGYADVIVAAPEYTAGQSREGAVFVFLGSSTGIANGNPSTAATQLESNIANGFWGQNVAGAGDVNADGYGDVIVGAGTAFVFHGSPSGIASGDPATANRQLHLAAGFGAVAGAGDTNGDGYGDVILGSYLYDNGQTDEGAAFVFHGSASGVVTTVEAQLESNQPSAEFGRSVAGAGDVNGDGYADVIVGARLFDAGHFNEGAAFVYLGGSAGVVDGNTTTAAAQLEGNQTDAWLGWSVAGAGDVNGDGHADVIAGAYLYDNVQSNEGAAFVYHGGGLIADGTPATASAQLESNQSGAFLGSSVAGAGDVNGDGYADVIVGAYQYDSGQTNEGAAFVFLGSASGIASSNPAMDEVAELESNQAGAFLGWSVAGAGDVNGDGYADVIVGAYQYDSGQTNEGAAFVFLGSASGIASSNPAMDEVAQLESNQTDSQLGTSVAGAGDVNGDGYADVIVGAYQYDSDQTNEGAAFVFLGGAAGISDGDPLTASAQLESDQADALLGYSVAGAGDVNGDGYSDVIAGAVLYDDANSNEGAAFVFHGGASGIADGNPATAAAQLESEQVSALLGSSVAAAGDVNGDGYADVIVGAYQYDSGQTDEGAAFVFHGGESGIGHGNPATAAAQLESNQTDAQLDSVAGAGDVNGDGYSDVIAGAPQFDRGTSNVGAAFVFLGSAAGIADGNPDPQLESNQGGELFGISVAGVGDVNGDGYADVCVGSNGYYAGQSNEGAAFVFLGNSAGRPVLARQRRGNGSGVAVQPFGLAQSTTGFTAELRASHPAGRGRVKAEFQACPSDGPPAAPFGDASCTTLVSPSWLAVNGTTPEVLISQTFSGLTNNTLYRWRARVLHAPATGTVPAIPEHGPWRRLGAQSVEADIRLPEPGLLVSLACGLALVASLAHLRRR